jgi:7,8-dihydro-6-hydroxymethylpterin dimethyltransferase
MAAQHRLAVPNVREGNAPTDSERRPVDIDALVAGHDGEIKAHILERNGAIVIEKTCPTHGTFTDTLAIDSAFLRRIENLFPGRDFRAVTPGLHDHGTSSIQHGRGAVLTIDLTNRCNMMCDPCFMDANQVGYVHELTLSDVKQLLDDAMTVKPRRQMTVQFSGGEPTISPHFLEAVRYARDVGYFSVQAATNGIRFAQEPDFARQARDAGLRIAYLQFDGVGEEANAHRKVGNLFAVKLRAIEALHDAGIDVCLVVTIVNGSTTTRWDRSSSLPCRTATRSVSCRSSRCPSPVVTKTSAMPTGTPGATRCRTSRATSKRRPA